MAALTADPAAFCRESERRTSGTGVDGPALHRANRAPRAWRFRSGPMHRLRARRAADAGSVADQMRTVPASHACALQESRLPINQFLIDHCPPARLREENHNVTFGTPRHRGATGGKECERAFGALCDAIAHEFREHDVLIRALALHYHLGAMHPFLDGNGRTARAVEALMLQRAGLRDALFIALSNYYYEEKSAYLTALASVRQANGDLTEFVLFGLRGMTLQCQKLLAMINESIYKVLYKDVANDLFNRLQSKKKRGIAKRQLTI